MFGAIFPSMQIGMRQISAETVEWFRGACNGGDLSRTGLAHELCVRENWFGRLGGLCLASGRKLLPPLAEELGVRLPEAEAMEFAPHARPARDFADSSFCGSLGDLGALSLARVSAAEDRRRWGAMIETHHPEGWCRPPAGQVRYRVCSQRYGVLGGIGFTAAGIQLGPRDAEIGWSFRTPRPASSSTRTPSNAPTTTATCSEPTEAAHRPSKLHYPILVIDPAGIAGFDSTRRQSPPGTWKLPEACLSFERILI